jgi:hypothetical protein
VKQVINIQVRYIYKALVTGWTNISRSKFLSCTSLSIKRINTKKSNGSVGRNISKLNPYIRSPRDRERGVKNIMKYNILSKEKITKRAIPRINGNRLIMRKSFLMTNHIFNKIKLIEMR